jgi:hypothetical protein
MREDGAERLYVLRLNDPAANLGVSVIDATDGAQIDPFVLGSKSEADVQGYAGTPVDVNPLTFDYRINIGAAGASLPRPKTYYVVVDSGRDIFTGRLGTGRYLLQSWVNDVFPPLVLPVTTRVAAGRPTIVARVVDGAFGEPTAGVDPLSLVISYQRVLVGAAAYDPASGLAIFPLPAAAPELRAGPRQLIVVASDYQEAKNVNTSGADIMPNTGFRQFRVRVLAGPSVTWLAPEVRACVAPEQQLLVTAGSPAAVQSVRFLDGSRPIATVRRGTAQLYSATWRTRGAGKGRHVLRAVMRDAQGRTAIAERAVRVC